MMTNFTLLIAEDDENDALLVTRAIKKKQPTVNLQIVPDGVAAIEYFKGEGKYADRSQYPFPRILITDLKMPRVNGFELLKWLQDHQECNVIPAIVLSASKDPEDVKRAYRLGANAFFQKPSSIDDLTSLFDLNFHYWFRAEVPVISWDKKCN